MENKKLQELFNKSKKLYLDNKDNMAYGGWHHIIFIFRKSQDIASELGANQFIVASASLLVDIRDIVGERHNSPKTIERIRKLLVSCKYTIEEVMEEAHLSSARKEKISAEAMALADASTIFKIMPSTAIFLIKDFLVEKRMTINQLSKIIVEDHSPLLEQGKYLYTNYARENYLFWTKTCLNLWKNLKESLEDKDVKESLQYLVPELVE